MQKDSYGIEEETTGKLRSALTRPRADSDMTHLVKHYAFSARWDRVTWLYRLRPLRKDSVRVGAGSTAPFLHGLLQRLIHDVEMIARPPLEIGDLSQRKHLAGPAPVHGHPIPDAGCADESLPITFPVDSATLWRA